MNLSQADINVDVLLITPTKDEYEAAKLVQDELSRDWIPKQDSAGFEYLIRTIQLAGMSPLCIALARPAGMGETPAASVATRLIHELKPTCLAMSGICAGRRSKVSLGDVIVANNVFNYEKGKERPGSTEKLHDIETYNLKKQWKQAAEDFDLQWCSHFTSSRPMSLDCQENWVLYVLHADPTCNIAQDPLRKVMCPNWKGTISRLEKKGYIELPSLRLTEKGEAEAKRMAVLHLDGAPTDPDFQLHVAPMATGSVVIKNPQIFEDLEIISRNILAVEMEANAVGFVAEIEAVEYALIVKGVSDYADEWKDDAFHHFAARASAEFVVAFLSKYLPRRKAGEHIIIPATVSTKLAFTDEQGLSQGNNPFDPDYQLGTTAQSYVKRSCDIDLLSALACYRLIS